MPKLAKPPSKTMLGGLQEKAMMQAKARLGSFTLTKNSHKPKIFTGIGTGFAPTKSMLQSLINTSIKDEITVY